MAKYGFNNFQLSFDNSGGTPVDMTAYVMSVNDVTIESIIEESTPAGVSWPEHLATGIKQGPDVTIGGIYDDTASTGPNVIFNRPGSTGTLLLTWGGGKTTSCEAIIVSYTRTAASKTLTKYSVVLRPTGTITEA